MSKDDVKIYCAYDKERECDKTCVAYKTKENYGLQNVFCLRGKFEIINESNVDEN